jgi:putative ABC transport system ATP-binding protein
MDTVLAAERLGKQVSSPEGTLAILADVTLEVRRGESVAVVGASGAGKSTLLALLAGLDEPTSGRVWLAGRELTALDEDGRAALRARHVGFVFQSFHLVPALTALENVMLPLELAGRADARRTALEVLARVGLAERVGHYPRQLSGGEQQRVAVARALVSRPRIVFADEPTGNLDSQSGAEVLDLLRRSVDEHGQTVVMVTHDPVAAAYTDRVVFLADGRVVHELRDPTRDSVLEAQTALAAAAPGA